jgi:hypothetical protein
MFDSGNLCNRGGHLSYRNWFWTSLLLSAIACTHSGVSSANVISYGRAGGQPATETLGGTTVRAVDVVDTGSNSLLFSAFPDSPPEDIDAFHMLGNGSFVFSTSTDVTQGFGGLSSFKNGSLVLWDGSTASLLADENTLFGGANADIDGFSILSNGNWLMSTSTTAAYGGGTFLNGDLVEYNPINDIASLYMGLGESTLFTGSPQSNPDIDALHALADGSVIFSLRTNGLGGIGNNFNYATADAPSTDLFSFDPSTGVGGLFLEGAGLFDGRTRNVNAVFVPIPEPNTMLLAALGLVWLSFGKRPRS